MKSSEYFPRCFFCKKIKSTIQLKHYKCTLTWNKLDEYKPTPFYKMILKS